MKRLDFYYFLTLFLAALFLFGTPSFKHLASARDYAAHPTKEQRASHMVQFFDKHGSELGQCSATAVGPHAFLTAYHCDEHEKATQVTFDLATEKHDIVDGAIDNRDHIIFLVTGTPFVNAEEVHQASAKVGDNVVFYGDGEETYPPQPKYGTVLNCYDPSDIDEASGIACFTTHPLEGDSGSAIYNSKGEIVSLLTYGAPDGTSVGFALNFPVEVLEKAKTFDGKVAASEGDINDLIQQMLGARPTE